MSSYPVLADYNNNQKNLENIVEAKFYKEGRNPNLILYYLISVFFLWGGTGTGTGTGFHYLDYF